MIKRLFIICMLAVMLFSGCTHKNENVILENNETTDKSVLKKTVLEDPISEEDDSWKYEVAERLYEEFCYFYEHMPEDDPIGMEDRNNRAVAHNYNVANNRTGYNRIMAADRATGILEVYKEYLSEDKIYYVSSKCDKINDKIGFATNFYFGYSHSGLHYMAINYMYVTSATYWYPFSNKVRGLENETDFMEDMWFDANITIVDIYVEDLREKRTVINLEPEFIDGYSANDQIVLEKQYHLLLEGEGLLKKYNRELVPKGIMELNNKSWNLYAIKNTPVDIVNIISYGEKIELSQRIPLTDK